MKLRSGCHTLLVPEYIECSAPGESTDIEIELKHWGLTCRAFRFGSYSMALCLPTHWSVKEGQFHYMFCHEDLKDPNGAFLHTSDRPLDDLCLMQLLYKFGYCRAAILNTEDLLSGLQRIIFLDVVQQHGEAPDRLKRPLPWPGLPDLQRNNVPFLDLRRHRGGGDDFLIKIGISPADLVAFFDSGADVLCKDPTGYDLPDTTMQAMKISDTSDLAQFDRVIIYTDGSSLPHHLWRFGMMMQALQIPGPLLCLENDIMDTIRLLKSLDGLLTL